MNAERSELQKASNNVRILGMITILFGVLAIAMPWITGQSVLLLIGILVAAGGVSRMIWAFRASTLGRGVLVFLIGVLTLLAGIAVISHPLLTSAVLTIMLAVYFLADGFSELLTAFALPSGRPGKGWLVFDGLVTLILGVMIFSGFPLAGTFAIGVLLGIKLLLAGTTMLTLGAAARSALR